MEGSFFPLQFALAAAEVDWTGAAGVETLHARLKDTRVRESSFKASPAGPILNTA